MPTSIVPFRNNLNEIPWIKKLVENNTGFETIIEEIPMTEEEVAAIDWIEHETEGLGYLNVTDGLRVVSETGSEQAVYEINEVQKSNSDNSTFIVEEIPIDELPAFPGGPSELYRYINSNLKYPVQARKIGIERRVYVEFVVEKDGSISNVRTVEGIGAGCDAEALRVMEEAPSFKPGVQRESPVRVKMRIPIDFKLNK